MQPSVMIQGAQRAEHEPYPRSVLRATGREGGVEAPGHRPRTPACAACSRRGTLLSRGYHHSMECRRRYQQWLRRQVPPLVAEQYVADAAGAPQLVERLPTRRLIGKTAPKFQNRVHLENDQLLSLQSCTVCHQHVRRHCHGNEQPRSLENNFKSHGNKRLRSRTSMTQ